MLRIKYKKGQHPFEFRNITRTQCKDVIKAHVAYWGRELIKDKDGNDTIRKIAPQEFEAHWQDGDGEWDDTKPVTPIPIS